ncbi:MAG: PHP domain-containing protein, partial [Elainellaceae cyanobacterium]
MAVDFAPPQASSQSSQDIQKLRQVFSSISVESCPQHYNFHMHTVFSDGQMQPEQLVEQAIRNGLRGFAITDHHSTSGFRRAQQWLRKNARADAPHLW